MRSSQQSSACVAVVDLMLFFHGRGTPKDHRSFRERKTWKLRWVSLLYLCPALLLVWVAAGHFGLTPGQAIGVIQDGDISHYYNASMRCSHACVQRFRAGVMTTRQVVHPTLPSRSVHPCSLKTTSPIHDGQAGIE